MIVRLKKISFNAFLEVADCKPGQTVVSYIHIKQKCGESMAKLTIDTAAVCRNYQHYAQQGMVIPVLKDNAYGMGADTILSLLRRQGVTLFACSKPEEALLLAGQGADILLLTCIHDEDLLRALADKQVILAIESLSQAEFLNRIGLRVRVHLAVDTGFGRFGFSRDQTEDIKQVFSLENLAVEGIFSHFRSQASAPEQFSVFQQFLSALEGYPVGIRHIAATGNAHIPEYRLDAVRIGTGLTGLIRGLDTAVEFTAAICTIRRLPKGSRIGYTSTKLKRDTDVAIIDAGTADGAFVYRSCGPRTWLQLRKRSVDLNGSAARVIGTPGLTHTAIDVTGIPCQIGDRVRVAQTPVLISPAVPREYSSEKERS